MFMSVDLRTVFHNNFEVSLGSGVVPNSHTEVHFFLLISPGQSEVVRKCSQSPYFIFYKKIKTKYFFCDLSSNIILGPKIKGEGHFQVISLLVRRVVINERRKLYSIAPGELRGRNVH
jgi:hypothetical protein